jgi:transcriptional regulator with XRE-family HTH domain
LAGPSYQRERRRLSETLRRLRKEAGISGNQLAKQLRWPQSKVSKIETAKQLPTEDDIRLWIDGIGAPAEAVEELLLLLKQARAEYATWREHFIAAGGAAGKQASVLALEAQAKRIGEFQPAVVPGLVQTAEYARELMTLASGPKTFEVDEAEIADMVRVRMDRQRIIYRQDKEIQLVMLDGALRSLVCKPRTLAGQLDRLMAVIGYPSLELGIVPFEQALPLSPVGGFVIYDRSLVVVESLTGEQQISDIEQTEAYDRFFQQWREAAAYGDEAGALLRRALDELRARDKGS